MTDSILSAIVEALKVVEDGTPTGPVAGRVFRAGHVPEKVSFPYAEVLLPVSNAPALQGDSRALTWALEGQVDLWQKLEDEASDGDLWVEVRDVLDRNPLSAFEGGVYRCRFTMGTRAPSDEKGILHHVILFKVDHA